MERDSEISYSIMALKDKLYLWKTSIWHVEVTQCWLWLMRVVAYGLQSTRGDPLLMNCYELQLLGSFFFFGICKLIIWLEYWLTGKILFSFFLVTVINDLRDLSDFELNAVFLHNVWFRWCRYDVNVPASSRVARDTSSYAIVSIVATHNGCCACTIDHFVCFVYSCTLLFVFTVVSTPLINF